MKKLILFLTLILSANTFSQDDVFDDAIYYVIDHTKPINQDETSDRKTIDSLISLGYPKITTDEQINYEISDSLDSWRVTQGYKSLKTTDGNWPESHFDALWQHSFFVAKDFSGEMNRPVAFRYLNGTQENCNCSNSIVETFLEDSVYMIGKLTTKQLLLKKNIKDFITIYEQHTNQEGKIEEHLHLILIKRRFKLIGVLYTFDLTSEGE